ncbi:stage II sporulation protein P [Filibacter tadaridae]|uniref:Stage II sporulation protein P (SpoIIP) n=1 Tax=Filibacter tadaridae TaxID=2483811 RepID=A0A3P5XWL7_9BACL|nr:stage II sporulation protein P [Filibacter tadaridae]VDC32539.1 Stage II sporulation protein P (SpoIIP) [Filibacter tadaridae]
MKKTLQIWGTLILILFLFPVIITNIPGGAKAKSTEIVMESPVIVYASNISEEELPKEIGKKALLYFTHSHEAYEPVTKAHDGKVTVSHQSENITKFGEKLKKQLIFNGVQTDILPIDNAKEMSKKGIPHYRAYNAIRPAVKKRIQEQQYDLIVDVHRDALGPDKTTIVNEGEKYAKVAFVIGVEHPNYKKNRAQAKLIKDEMERLVPGITRNLIMKGGKGVDGKYNQDLHPSLLVLELGGYGNTEDQLNRTVAVIAKATATVLSD